MTTFDINIAQVSVKANASDHKLLTLKQFLQIDIKERTKLTLTKKVDFIDYNGESIATLQAIKEINSFINELKSSKKLLDYLNS